MRLHCFFTVNSSINAAGDHLAGGSFMENRRGSRINTDRFPKRGVAGALASRGDAGNFFLFLKSVKFPFPGFGLMPGN